MSDKEKFSLYFAKNFDERHSVYIEKQINNILLNDSLFGNGSINEEAAINLFLTTEIECFLTRTAVLAKHRPRAPRYVACGSNERRTEVVEVERNGAGEGWGGQQ